MPEHVTADQLSDRFGDKKLIDVFYERLMERVLVAILPYAQQRTPVLTGATRASETYRVERGGRKGYLQAGTDYSPFVHRREPFFALGIKDAQGDVRKVLEEEGLGYLNAVIE